MQIRKLLTIIYETIIILMYIAFEYVVRDLFRKFYIIQVFLVTCNFHIAHFS